VTPECAPMSKTNDKPLIIITGSSGNIGKALTAALKNNYQIVGFDQN